VTLPVYVCSIAKNEAKHVRRWAESAKDADGIFLLDTGSTDDTVAIAKECGVTVFEKTYEKWSFAAARNDLREMLPDNDAWLVNLDLDEIFVDGWRPHMDNAPTDVNRLRYEYTWSWKEDGTPGLKYHGDKIVRRHSHIWVNKVHEVNITREGVPELQAFIGLQIHHHADNTKSRSNYLPLLLEDVEENPNNDRNTYYAARELFFHGRFEEATVLFKRHLTMPESTWNAERAWSMRYLSKMHPTEAEHWLLRACAEYPHGAEVWVDLAKHYYISENWIGMYYAAKRALTIPYSAGLYLTETDAYGWWPNDMAALAAHRIGLDKEALHYGEIAVALSSDDDRLKSNLFFYKLRGSKINVVIPTKTNISGLTKLVGQLLADTMVNKIIIVADGSEAYNNLSAIPQFNKVIKVMVNEGVGIHAMWNLGMNIAGYDGHVAFINDDVSLEKDSMYELGGSLSKNHDYGLICPSYSTVKPTEDRVVTDTCRSRYDGTGGMAGFCMVLAENLVPQFRFDEDMKWWYGDDMIVDWVTKQNRKCVISAATSCVHEDSKTIKTNPPKDFAAVVANDKKIYEGKKNA
jgi:glycosyltransferase involved in cell wall biosynthesis